MKIIFSKSGWQALLILGLWVLSSLGVAQNYPSKPITLYCWSEAGSPVDMYARLMAQLLSQELGVSVIVENRTGADGLIMVNLLLKAPADGYTLATNTLSLATLFSQPNVNFKPDDLQLIARSQVDPFGLLTSDVKRFKTIDDFVNFARAHPQALSVAGPFEMSAHRVAWEVFSELAKISTRWIPYKGGGPALIAGAGGQVDAIQTNPGNAKQYLSSGKLHLLAVSSDQRLEDFPDTPTLKERGWNMVRYQWRGIMGKRGLPPAVLERLVAAISVSQKTVLWNNYLRSVTQLDGFQGPVEFKAQLLKDIIENDKIKTKLGI